eukprot:GFKZ01004608.1.p1 GENE.GFKZ01004608.1~~GFKZ01004608.1.p1  ORF type:complete len:191 (-),score=14.65 GFKZ01004608.1:412-930(-)
MTDFSYEQIPSAATPAPAPAPSSPNTAARSRFNLSAIPRPFRPVLITCLLISATLLYTSNLLPPLLNPAPEPSFPNRMYYPAPQAPPYHPRFAPPPPTTHRNYMHPPVSRMHPGVPVHQQTVRYPGAYELYETETMPMNPRVEQELLRRRLEQQARQPVAAPQVMLPDARLR